MNVKSAKAELRSRIWRRMQEHGVSRFPGAQGRIPNFVGAENAARRLDALDRWTGARNLKCNPDTPQLPVRKAALVAGKTVFMAVPRLADPKPFLRLDPDQLDVPPHKAATIKGAARHGRPTAVTELPRIDLVIAGSVAVAPDGSRLGKGGGYSDLEFALAREAGLIHDSTAVVTTVHPLQIVGAGVIPMNAHDVPLDFLVTPEEIVPTERAYERPSGVIWDELDDEKLRSIPVLGELERRRDQR